MLRVGAASVRCPRSRSRQAPWRARRCPRNSPAGKAPTSISFATRCCRKSRNRGSPTPVDAFCEPSPHPAETERIFATAQRLGLPVKLHADQFLGSRRRGLGLGSGAFADHIEYASEASVRARRAVVPLRCCCPAPISFCASARCRGRCLAQVRRADAIASNCNPGSAPVLSIPADARDGGDAVR